MAQGLHIVAALSGSGGLVHTIRRTDGTWFPLGDVKAQTGDPGVVNAVSCAEGDHQVHVVVQTNGEDVFHTIRQLNGVWYPFGNVKLQCGDPGAVADVCCAATTGSLHVVVSNDDGGIFHTIRRPDGSWFPFGDVKEQAGNPGDVRSLAVAAIGLKLHVVVQTEDGGVFHTIRRADGTWLSFGDVKQQTGDPGEVHYVTAAGLRSGLHVLVSAGDDSEVFHTIRRIDGNWFPFGSVTKVTSYHDPTPPLEHVAAARSGAALDVAATLRVPLQGFWVTLRNGDGSWDEWQRPPGGVLPLMQDIDATMGSYI